MKVVAKPTNTITAAISRHVANTSANKDAATANLYTSAMTCPFNACVASLSGRIARQAYAMFPSKPITPPTAREIAAIDPPNHPAAAANTAVRMTCPPRTQRTKVLR